MIIKVQDPTGRSETLNIRGGSPLGELLGKGSESIAHVQINGHFRRDWKSFVGGDSNADRVQVFMKTGTPDQWIAGIGLALSLVSSLASALLAQKPKKPNFNNRQEDSTSLVGLHNATETGSPMFYSFGENRIYGTVISSGIDVAPDGKSMRGRILYYMGVTDGHGIQSIGDIIINDQPIENHPDIGIEVRLGTADQTVIPGFENVSQSFADQRTFTVTQPVTYTSRLQDVNQMKPTIAFPSLSGISKSGKMTSQFCDVKVERKLTADPIESFAQVNGSPFRFTGQTNSPIYFPIDITLAGVGAGDQWDLRFTKVTEGDSLNSPPDPQLYNVEEIEWTTRNYPKCALLGLTNIPSADFPSLQQLRVSALERGNLIPVPDGVGGWTYDWTRERVWIFRYMATDPHFGCGSGARRQLPSRVMTKAEFPGLIDNPRSLL